jgi:hypothetical protein
MQRLKDIHLQKSINLHIWAPLSVVPNNDWFIELNNRIIKAEKASFLITKYLIS